MTDLYNGELMDMLRNTGFCNDTQVKCISHALKATILSVMNTADKTMTRAGLDKVPEKILDTMAIELNTPYYRGDLNIDIKRNLLANTLKWNYKAGTPAAVSELVSSVFGDGMLIEWFDFDVAPFTPGTFDIIADVQITEDIVEQFLDVVWRTKNMRSHIRKIVSSNKAVQTQYFGGGVVQHMHNVIV